MQANLRVGDVRNALTLSGLTVKLQRKVRLRLHAPSLRQTQSAILTRDRDRLGFSQQRNVMAPAIALGLGTWRVSPHE